MSVLTAAGLAIPLLVGVLSSSAFLCVIVARLLVRFLQSAADKDKHIYVWSTGISCTYQACKLLVVIAYKVVTLDPFLLLNVRNWQKAGRFSFNTGTAIAQAHLTCVRWSASSLKSLAIKAYSPYGKEITKECKFPFGVMPAWAREDGEKHRHILKQYNTKFSLFRALPLRTLSRLFGVLTRVELPMWLRAPILKLYIYMFTCKPEECKEPDLHQYTSLCAFFRRNIRTELRPIHRAHLTSPADGKVLYVSEVQNGVLEQVKGVSYSLQGFLGPPEGLLTSSQQTDQTVSDAEYAKMLVSQPGNRLFHAIIYLGPGDYHHFHSPATWAVHSRRHFPGELFSVNPSFARWMQGLFNMNERAIYTGRWQYGFFSMAAVGATNVGSINVNFDPSLETNMEDEYEAGIFYDENFNKKIDSSITNTRGMKSCKSGLRINKGSEVGDFSFGSTIVLIFEAPKSFVFNVGPGEIVRVGQALGHIPQRKTTPARG